MSQQPSGPGQPWPQASQPPPWDTGRQPQPQPPHPQQQRPMLPPPMPQAYAPARDQVFRLSIWRLALGIWLGTMLVVITFILLGILLALAGADSFNVNTGDGSRFSLTSRD